MSSQLFSVRYVSSGHVGMLLLSLLNIIVSSAVHFFNPTQDIPFR